MKNRNVVLRFFIITVMAAVLLTILPLFFRKNEYVITIVCLSMIWAVYGASWDILFGYTGLLNFGQLFSAGVAAYIIVLLKINFNLPDIFAIIIGLIGALISGVIIGVISFRVRQAYFALSTFAITIILERICLTFTEFLGGEYGLSIERRCSLLTMYYIIAVVFLFALISLFLVSKSKIGIALRSIKGDEEAARAVGINVSSLKIFACVLSAFFTGAAGVCYLYILKWVGPTIFGMFGSFQVVMFSIVGGPGYIWGAALGCGGLSIVFEAIHFISEWRNLVYALLLVVIVSVFSGGVWGEIDYLRRRKMKKAAETGR